jgi:hypothetical protein
MDFEYLQEDEALAKSSLQGYRYADRQGFIWGSIIGIPLGLSLAPRFNRYFTTRKGTIFVPLITASLV